MKEGQLGVEEVFVQVKEASREWGEPAVGYERRFSPVVRCHELLI